MKIQSASLSFSGINCATKQTTKTNATNTIAKKAVISVAAASAIAAATLIKPIKNITVDDIENKFKQKGFSTNDRGFLQIKLTPEQEQKIDKRFGNFATNLKWWIQQANIDKEDLKEFQSFINTDKKLGQEMFNKHFDNLVDNYFLVKKNKPVYEKIKQDKNVFKLFANIVNNEFTTDEINSIYEWNGKSYIGIAHKALVALREQAKNPNLKIEKEVQTYINNLSNAIKTQEIPEKTTLYRGEGFEVLNNVKLENGKIVNIGEAMKKATESNDAKQIAAVKEFFADNKITATQPGFISTSINKDIPNYFVGSKYNSSMNASAGIIWELSTTKGTKGFFVEGINSESSASMEQEILLQKGSKISDITSVEYKPEHKIWTIKAKVSN